MGFTFGWVFSLVGMEIRLFGWVLYLFELETRFSRLGRIGYLVGLEIC